MRCTSKEVLLQSFYEVTVYLALIKLKISILNIDAVYMNLQQHLMPDNIVHTFNWSIISFYHEFS